MKGLAVKIVVAGIVLAIGVYLTRYTRAGCVEPQCNMYDVIVVVNAAGAQTSCKRYDVSVAKVMFSHAADPGIPKDLEEKGYTPCTYCDLDCIDVYGKKGPIPAGDHAGTLNGTDGTPGAEAVHLRCGGFGT